MTTFADNDAYVIGYGPCTTDVSTETIDSLVASATVTISTTQFVGTSLKSLAIDMTANGNKALVQASNHQLNSFTPANGSGIGVVSFGLGLSGAPTSEAGIFSGDTGNGGGSAPSARRYIRVGTDRKLYFYDRLGAQLAVSTSLIPIAGAAKRVTVSYDNLNNHASTWMKVYMDDVEELAFDAGTNWAGNFANDYPYFGEYLGAAVNRGCTLYLSDAVARFSGTAAEAPHITAYPIVKVVGSVTPDADATYTDWVAFGPSAPNRWACVQTNDGTTNDISVSATPATVALKDTVKSSAANPMVAGATVLKAQLRQVGQKSSAGKGTQILLYGALGSEVDAYFDSNYVSGSVGTTMAALCINKLFQDGVSVPPVYTDANPNVSAWGARTLASGNVNSTVTYAPGPEWVHYTSLLPAGTGPPTSPAPDTSVVGTATYAGVT